MKILCVETTLAKCSVCLSSYGQEELVVASEDFMHSEQLFVLIEKLMNKHKLSYEELDFIACTVGPGSFGGLRVGVAAVNALKILVPKVQVLGFNTLEVVANAALPIDAKSLVAVSHGNKCYIARSDTQGRLLEEISAVHKDELAALVGKNAKLITVESGNSFIPGSKVVNLNAAAVMRFAQKVIQEERINLYNQVSPIYISEPSITVAK